MKKLIAIAILAFLLGAVVGVWYTAHVFLDDPDVAVESAG